MEQSALLAALVAVTAAIALALGAAALGPTLADAGDEADPVEPPDDPPEPGESGGSGASTPDGSDGPDASCSRCSALDLRSQVAALFPPVDPRLLLGALALGVVGLAAVGLRSTDDATAIASEHSDGVALAGKHRRRPESPAPDGDVDPTNDVYRAWLALGEALEEPRPAATSPRERARHAIEAGYPAGPVESLTRTFEAVRYGTAAPTPEHERRARAAIARLDRVELPDERGIDSDDGGSTGGGSSDGDPAAAGVADSPEGGDR